MPRPSPPPKTRKRKQVRLKETDTPAEATERSEHKRGVAAIGRKVRARELPTTEYSDEPRGANDVHVYPSKQQDISGF